jgi:hypothetical protein
MVDASTGGVSEDPLHGWGIFSPVKSLSVDLTVSPTSTSRTLMPVEVLGGGSIGATEGEVAGLDIPRMCSESSLRLRGSWGLGKKGRINPAEVCYCPHDSQ